MYLGNDFFMKKHGPLIEVEQNQLNGTYVNMLSDRLANSSPL